jgi:hypothetical protein
MAGDVPSVPVAFMPPLPDADEQSATQGKADVPPPSKTSATSTGQASVTAGAAGNTILGVQVAQAAQHAYSADRGLDVWMFVIGLAADPMFWAGTAVVVAACVAWAERSKLLNREAV